MSEAVVGAMKRAGAEGTACAACAADGAAQAVEGAAAAEATAAGMAAEPAGGATPASESTPAVPALSMRSVSFAYAGAGERVLEGVSWDVPQGAFALLVGETGSGKSTLLSLAKPEIAPAGERAGAIEVLGTPVEELDAAASARTVGYVFQNPDNQIVCESVWHEMAFGLENLGVEQGEMRRLVAETSYFFGMDQWFRDDTDALSGGRKQLLALASTLVMQPRVLLLDEPTAQLDPIAGKNFLHALFRVNRELGCTVVMATHEPRAMLDYATCAFRLRAGRIERVEDTGELRARPVLVEGEEAEGTGAEEPSSAATVAPELAPEAEPAEPAEPAASLARAWFRYERAGAWVLRNFDLAIRPGRIHALVGGNGCGKSTVLSILAGARSLQKGTARIAAPSRALLPQDPRALFVEETARAELMEWARAAGYTQGDADEMLGELGLSACAERHPYDLSGGQQQLLALGKLLLIRPRLLLLDEPTKGLDVPARRSIARILRARRADGVTVVMATHDLDFVEQVADDVSMMFDGEVACTEPSEEFFRGNVYYRP
ncbi:ABC transporter ATP-binding protein [uncultured Enorma sp.]|uniref:ABC transporter ATP-binding protein n=1 Tax=uncultured Enorma sp. TaxID=1714346 RepID=UPI002599A019|nr:ABC transporter ATP-binding protein [uncultured Enorma sp.]